VVGQAAALAVLAAVSPTALLVMAVFLGSANPRATALAYVAGAMIMTVIMAVTVLLVLRGLGLNQPREHSPRYGLRLGLGVLALGAGAYLLRRGLPQPASPDQPQQKQGLIGRLTAHPRPALAFAAGLILFLPSATFVASVQVIATADASTATTAVALIVVVAISALIVWLPLLGYLAKPEATVSLLRRLNGWLRAHGRAVAVYGLVIGGVFLIINGSLGLASR
jgi:hypothetical protein